MCRDGRPKMYVHGRISACAHMHEGEHQRGGLETCRRKVSVGGHASHGKRKGVSTWQSMCVYIFIGCAVEHIRAV